MAKITPEIHISDKKEDKMHNLPVTYIGFKATVSFEEVGKFFKSIISFFKKK